MLKILSRVTAAAVLLLAAGQASAADKSPTPVRLQNAATRPSAVPANYVITPNGYFHPSCVHQIASDETVQADGSVRSSKGTVRQLNACQYPRYSSSGQRVEAGAREPVINNWVADSQTDTTTPEPIASAISANWIVPSAPAVKANQVVYFFPGLEAVPNVVTIVQPVLGWNAFNDNAWTLSSWNCCVDGSTTNSAPVTVAAGDQIYGLAYGDCASGTVCANWVILSVDETTGASTSLSTSAFGQSFNWYFGGVLEAYGIAACAQYPANGSVDFTNVKVFDINTDIVTPTWETNTTSVRPQCSYAVNATTEETSIGFSTRR